MAYYAGKAIWLANYTGSITNPVGGYRNTAGQLYDPPGATLRHQLPGGAVVNVTPPTLVKDAVGLYHFVVIPSLAGDGVYAYLSSDGAYAVGSFIVLPPPV